MIFENLFRYIIYQKMSNESEDEIMYVITRTGRKEPLDTNQITNRLKTLINKAPKIPHINPFELMLKVCEGLKSGITTYEIDEYAANASASLSVSNPHYLSIAARIAIDNHQKNTIRSFVDKMRMAYLNTDEQGGHNPLVTSAFYKYVEEHQDLIESMIDYQRDFLLDFFGFRTFQKSYSIKVKNKPIERPQDMFMRAAVALNMNTGDLIDELKNIKETYDLLSQKYYTHASPTYYNAGGLHQQLASCFLLGTEDSLEGIEKTGADMSRISKWAGGIGVHINGWRATGALIRGTNGKSSGIVPFLRTYETRMLAFNQGGRRPGSAAIYIMPHHPDLMKFIALRRNDGVEKERARDLFYALWIPDIFMERVAQGGIWSFFDPSVCGDLSDYTLDDYTKRYLMLEEQKKYTHQLSAREIWEEIYKSEKETGLPYICFSDHANRAFMQKNLGVVKSSNLCVAANTLILTLNGYQQIQELATKNGGLNVIWNGEEFTEAQFAKTSDQAKLIRLEFSDGTYLISTEYHRFQLLDGTIKTAIELTQDDVIAECKWPKLFKYDIEKILARLQPALNGYVIPESSIIDKYLCQCVGLNGVLKDSTLYFKTDINTGSPLYDIQASRCEPLKMISRTDAGYGPTYCFNEPKKHMGIFNGVPAMNCSEIILYSDSKEYAVCVLSSVSLPAFVFDSDSDETERSDMTSEAKFLNHTFPTRPYFDFKKLIEVVRVMVRNLNNVVDKTHHPIEETRRGNNRHRPIGIGVQGLDDAYSKMRYPFDSAEAAKLNKEIFECIYYAALTESSVMCRRKYKALKKQCETEGFIVIEKYPENSYDPIKVKYTDPAEIPKKVAAYPSMEWNGGAPIAKGVFHWEFYEPTLSGMFDWESLREHIKEFGVMNSLLVALMPTASTSQLLGNNECFEPYTSNVYRRETNAGEYIVIKKNLINDLYNLGLWNTNLKDYLLACEGSIQHIEGIPEHIKDLYKTVWEIDQSVLIQQAIDRQPFVDQAQSLNLYVRDLNLTKWTKLIFQGWRGKLKTGKYYLHTEAAQAPTKFTIDPAKQAEALEIIRQKPMNKGTTKVLKDICESCSG